MTALTPKPKSTARVTTLAGLAEKVGLSSTTVSFVLNGQAEQRKIPESTVRRVLEAAEAADYVPNALARGLRQKRTHAIGLVFPHLRGDWAHRITQGASQVLAEHRSVPLIVCHHGSGELERELLRNLVERRVDGIICNPLADGLERYRLVRERGVPLVFLSDAPKGLDEISYVGWDPSAVAIAVRHLIGLGHRRIAYLGVRDTRKLSIARRHAFCDALEEAGLDCPKRHLILNPPGEPFDGHVDRLLSGAEPPTAFFALYDDIAIAVLGMLKARGVRCPEQVSVATIGDSPLVTAPGHDVTTVTSPVEQEGRVCAETLMQLIERPKQGAIHRLVPGGELVVGRTTGPCPT
jgi:DNA-binding LacI/PurR family transcriptional regulator